MTSRAFAESCPSKPSRSTGQRDGHLYIGPSKPDSERLRSAIRTWIVPVLVRQFMEERILAGGQTEVNANNGTTEPLDKEGAGVSRIY